MGLKWGFGDGQGGPCMGGAWVVHGVVQDMVYGIVHELVYGLLVMVPCYKGTNKIWFLGGLFRDH